MRWQTAFLQRLWVALPLCLPIACLTQEGPLPRSLRIGLPSQWTEAASPFCLLILFSADDCPICLFEAEYWEEVHRESPGIQVIGLTNGSADFCDKFIQDTGIRFPVYRHPALFRAVLERTLTIHPRGQTPLKLLLDENRSVIYAESGTKDVERHQSLRRRIQNVATSSTVQPTHPGQW